MSYNAPETRVVDLGYDKLIVETAAEPTNPENAIEIVLGSGLSEITSYAGYDQLQRELAKELAELLFPAVFETASSEPVYELNEVSALGKYERTRYVATSCAFKTSSVK